MSAQKKSPLIHVAEGFVLASMFYTMAVLVVPPIVQWHQDTHKLMVSLDSDNDGIADA